ncbi:FtsK/SpoIIIE domain-containing protein [Isoptericola sp. NPDC057391]|uniref:FtsK/SpoIIIE domain-containing protein n=1 Tax=Isoptericola sp. NPDC057391 TaxID=3346117 RepID=UPI00362E3EAB
MSTSTVPALVVPAPGPARGRANDVRVTVRPGEDVLLPAGVPFGACRAGLADLLRRPELRHVPLCAGGVLVSDDDVVGHRPLLPGAVVTLHDDAGGGRARAGSTGPAAAVLDGPWLAARADGPTAGATVALSPGTSTALPGDAGAPPDRAVLVRVDPRRPDRVTVRLTGPARGPRGAARIVRGTAPARRRARVVGRVPRRWRADGALEVTGPQGARTWTLHRSGTVAAWLDAAPGRAGDSAEAVSTSGPGAGMLATAALPVVGSLVLAAVLRQPAYALFSLLGVATLVPQLLAARRRRRSGTDPSPTSGGPPSGPAAEHGGVPPRVVGGAPGPLLARLVAAHQASDGAWDAACARAAARARTAGPLAGAARPGLPALRRGSGGPEGAHDAGSGTAAARAVAELVPDGAIAVVGARADVLAAARSVVAELAAAGAAVDVVGARDAWSWCRWLPGSGPPLLVVDTPGTPDATAVTARPADVLARGGAVLLCLPDGAPVPSWCRTTWRVRAGRVRRAAPDGSAGAAPLVGVDEAWAEQVARLVAGLAGLRRSLGALDSADGHDEAGRAGDDGDPTDPRIPAAVPLVDLLDGPTDGLFDPGPAWDAAAGWAVPLGRDARGRPVTFDLVADGPHLLVAGTTGAGKSELLQSLVLGLATRRSPRDVALALVDFKGGASFGACGRLPHVVGQVTDLDPGLAGRALAGLRAELRRREHVLARHGAADLAALPPGSPDAPPRLVVVVDEFRALADDLPDFLPGLLRVAAQGRSLGVHLVLATQRPAGAVSADVRANVSARLALRVVDAADSLDVVETPAAARIVPGTPGRAVLRRGAEPPVALQCAHAAARPAAPEDRVRRAPDWASPPSAAPSVPDPPEHPADAGARSGLVGTLVDASVRAAAERGLRPGAAPWLPPLPERVRVRDLVEADDGSDDDSGDDPKGLPLALGDDPDRQRRTVVRWDPDTGHLAVVGRARSGRTTTLQTLAGAALDEGWHVHVLAPAAALARFTPLERHPGLGTLAGPASPRRAARLLRLLARGGTQAPARTLVVVDGVDELRAALAGPDPWDPLVRALATPGVAFALASDGATLGGLAARTGPRLVLLGGEAHADVLLGAPTHLAGRGGPAGRAAWLAREQVLCQVLLPGGPSGRDTGPSRRATQPAAAPVRVRPLPATVDEAELLPPRGRGPRHLAGPPDGPHDAVPHDTGPDDTGPHDAGSLLVPVGVGGDAAAPVALDVGQGALVTGPRASGRTAVLRLVVRRLAATGRLAGVVARDAALRRDAGDAPAVPPSPASLSGLLDGLLDGLPDGPAGSPGDGPADHRADARRGPGVLVVDDLDVLAQQHPLEAERIAALTDGTGLVLVAAASSTGTALAHRGALAELRARRTGVVLHPGERGADDLLGVPLADGVDPGPARPGRGALVQAGRVRAVQVARPSDAVPAAAASARRRLDDPAGHHRDEHRGGDEQQAEAREHRPDHPGGQQADADEALHDLPHDDRRPAAVAPRPQGSAGPDEQPREPDEEEHEEDAHGYAEGSAADELDPDHPGRAHEEDRLDHDPRGDDLQARRAGPLRNTVGVGRGGDRSAHDTSEYVRPAVSRQCDEALTLHAGETFT